MFAWGSQLDFVGGYDHGRHAGLVHVADRHISPGKKFFTWGAGEAPEPVRPPARPEALASLEEVYQAGLRLEQLHSAALDPEDYYREVLRRDSGHARANTALGIRAWQRGRDAEAEKFLAVAAARGTGSYMAPKDGEPHYYLGLAQRAQHKDREARAAFERAAWVAGWESSANYQLAEMSCVAGDFAQAAVHLERALAANAWHVKALTLQAAVLRRLGRAPEAAGLLARAAAVHPLDPWSAWERSLAAAGPPPKNRDDAQAFLEPAADYAAAALWAEAATVLAAASGQAAVDPLVKYSLAYCLEKSGKSADAAAQYAAAAQLPPDNVFPFRREALEVLLRARERNPDDHRAAYYLGNLCMLHAQFDRAIQQWEDSRRLNPALALVHRNLDHATAAKHFAQALETAPANLLQPGSASADDPEIYYHAARTLEKLGRAPEAARICENLIEAGNAKLADHLSMNFFASFGHSQSPSVRAAQAHYAIGLGLLGAGKKTEARQAFEQAAKLDGNHGAARKQLRAAN